MREEEKKRSSQKSKIKHFFKKRWVYPAIYVASAVVILSAVLWFQNANDETDPFNQEATDLSERNVNEPAIEVNRALENISMPVEDPSSVKIQKQFYDFDGTEEEQEAALVFYNNTYHPNTGIDIVAENGESFEVIAALSGKVTKVQDDQLLGNVIEIDHGDGIVTQYQSVTDIEVEVGDEVKQGDTIANAGKSLYNEEAGTHLHFEIRKDNIPVNPVDFFNKPFSALQDANVDDETETEESNPASEGTTDETEEKDEESTDEQSDEDSNTDSDEDENSEKKDTEDSQGA